MSPIESRLSKARRLPHPSVPAVEPETKPTARTGEGMVRKSLYIPEDVAAALDRTAGALFFDARGKVTKAAAYGALIESGLAHVDAAYKALGVSRRDR